MKEAMQIKFCGLQSIEDYIIAWKLGVEYVGFVIYDPSPRNISMEHAKKIIDSIRASDETNEYDISNPLPKSVGLCVDMTLDEVLHLQKNVGFDVLQLYDISLAQEVEYDHWIVKSIANKEDIIEASSMASYTPFTKAVLLDTKHKHLHGGTGTTFNWEWLSELQIDSPYFIAGGINIHTIDSLLSYKPYGIDLSSGIEKVRGVKDYTLMEDIVKLVRGSYVYH